MDASLTRRLVKRLFTPCGQARPPYTAGLRIRFCFAGFLLLTASPAGAVPMTNDPKGFEGIPWGAAFSETANFVVAEEAGRIKGYELKGGPPPLGPAPVDSMRFMTVDGKFARVIVKYHGSDTHRKVVGYLQAKFGPLDASPGQIAGGAFQEYAWQGEESQISLTYNKRRDLGVIFFESRALAPSFAEGMMPIPDLGGATF
ncbi:MAG: hypothetical protein AB1555_02170 [Nitrospirota bacterium]